MEVITIIYIIISLLLSIGSFLPEFGFKHWSIRIFDFVRVQLLVIQVTLFTIGFFMSDEMTTLIWITEGALLLAMLHNFRIIWPYLSFLHPKKKPEDLSNTISMISINVLIYNNDFQKLINLINERKPDIVLTMESDHEWGRALKPVENKYKHCKKIPKKNGYGMHFYTNLDVIYIKEDHLLTENRPYIEARMKDSDGTEFLLWAIHPPPPGPGEKPTSKQKDAELMKLARKIQKTEVPNIVIGDFNNVCWSRASKLFCETSHLIDARKNHGILGTFPVHPRVLRFPIDLMFHSKEIELSEFKTLENVGSDHLPLFTKFAIAHPHREAPNEEKPEQEEEVDEIIEEGEEAMKHEPEAEDMK